MKPERAISRGFFTVAVATAIACAGCGKTYAFDSIEVGDDGAARAPTPRSNSQYIRSVYADLLGRSPAVYDFVITDAADQPLTTFPIDEKKLLLGALEGVGDPDPLRATIAAGLVASPEAALPEKTAVADPGAFVTLQFQKLLGRDPGTYEQKAFVDAWKKDDAVGPRVVVRAIVGSREYQSQ
jgi:hypothetical protein